MSGLVVELDIPRLPPSVNHAYTPVRARGKSNDRMLSALERMGADRVSDVPKSQLGSVRLIKSPAARDYTILVGEVAMLAGPRPTLVPPIELEIWLYVARSKPRRDADNAVKILQDALSRAYGFDDDGIHHLHVHKVMVDRDEHCLVRLSERRDSA